MSLMVGGAAPPAIGDNPKTRAASAGKIERPKGLPDMYSTSIEWMDLKESVGIP
jgi:hypothetical protein